MTTVLIFDLDDTLVSHRLKVPRQTYHMLNAFKKSGIAIGIISFNRMAWWVCGQTKLFKYTNNVFYGDLDRDMLFEQCLNSIANENETIGDIYYIDDRLDNIEKVNAKFKQVKTFHCHDIYSLYTIKRLICAT